MSEPLTFAEFCSFREFLRGSCGLYFEDDKYPRVAAILVSRMAELDIASFSEYHRMLVSGPGGKVELTNLAERLTVGETHFSRNKDQWRALGACVLPWIAEQNAAGGQRRIRIWSAGCSTGEEAYNASMVIRESLPDAAEWNIEIIATDISPAAIAKARRAIYTANSFRGVPENIIKEYFDPVENGRYRLHDDIRRTVSFQELNLLDRAAMERMRDFDVIFCRNVLIYFDSAGIQQVLADFHRSLRSGGYLFLGHSESLHGKVPGFACLHVCDTFIYKIVPLAGNRPEKTHATRPLENISEHGQVKEVTKAATFGLPASADDNIQSAGHTTDVRPVHPTQPDQRHDQDARDMQPPPSSVRKEPAAPTVRSLRDQGIKQLLAEQYPEAKHTFEQIIEQQPNDVSSLLYLALAIAESGGNESALKLCDRVLQLQPMCAEAYCVKALVYEELGNDATALAELDKAVYLDDGFAIAHFRMAGLHDRAGRGNDAMRQYANTLKTLPKDNGQRVQLYSGGFNTTTITQTCERRLGAEMATSQDINA